MSLYYQKKDFLLHYVQLQTFHKKKKNVQLQYKVLSRTKYSNGPLVTTSFFFLKKASGRLELFILQK